MRKPAPLTVIAVTLAAALPAGVAVAATVTKTVKVGDDWFVADTSGVPVVTIKRNTTVKFKFVGENPHNVLGYRGTKKKFESDILTVGVYKKQFRETGTFKIVCDIHGADQQSMKIVVRR